jgi:predicted 2-oxoglutarate/Fe(II)-dependent dioxygenase YbiX
VETRLTLAMQLLTGERAPLDPVQAAALLTAAADEGDAEAAALLATVEAMGVAGPQSWERALGWLNRAADLGSESARAQLALLGGDIGSLIAPPAKRSLSEAPRIRVIEGFATAAECDWVMARAHGRLGPAMVLDQLTGLEATHPDRTNKAIELNVTAMDVVLQMLRARIATATNLPLPVFEPAQIMHYGVGEEFRPHYDFLTDDAAGWAAQLKRYGQRIATFLLYLNEDFEGGETDFPSVGISHRGRRGDALFFANVDPAGAPDRMALHAGKPPTRGEKWILSQWIRDRTPGPAEAA